MIIALVQTSAAAKTFNHKTDTFDLAARFCHQININ